VKYNDAPAAIEKLAPPPVVVAVVTKLTNKFSVAVDGFCSQKPFPVASDSAETAVPPVVTCPTDPDFGVTGTGERRGFGFNGASSADKLINYFPQSRLLATDKNAALLRGIIQNLVLARNSPFDNHGQSELRVIRLPLSRQVYRSRPELY
jgi:hypothetical protein